MATSSLPKSADYGVVSERLDFLDGLRAVAALFVVMHHMYIQVWNIFAHRHPVGILEPLLKWTIYGHFSVTMFIVLSGFVIMMPIARGDGKIRGGAVVFLRRRAKRILPPYYYALLFSLLMLALIRKIEGSVPVFAVSMPSLITHLLLIHNLSPSTIGDINGALWFIAVQVQLYLLFPVLILLWQRLGPLFGALTACIFGYLGYFLLRDTSLRGLTPHYLAIFAIGMLGASVVFSNVTSMRKLRALFPWRSALWISTIATAAFCYYLDWEKALGPYVYLSDLLFGLSTVFLLINASLPGSNRLRDFLSLPYLTKTGTFAYSIYLVHLPIVQLLWNLVIKPMHLPSAIAYFLLISIGGPIIIGFASLFYQKFERPFQNSKR